MPIRPENRKRYPPNWKAISQRIRFERAGGRCECEGECGQNHYAEFDDPVYAEYDIDLPSRHCAALHGAPHPVTGKRVVLTVAHLDHTPENCDDDNLKAMCQRCHNRYDAPMRRRGILERKRIKSAMGDLFAGFN